MAISMAGLRGSTQLVFDCISGVTGTVEKMHETVARRPFPLAPRPAGQTNAHGQIAVSVYKTIQAVSGVMGRGLGRSMEWLETGPEPADMSADETRWVAALNGICGDHLESTGNPLALPMTLMTPQLPLELTVEFLEQAYPVASPNLLVMVHGLGCSEQNWSRNGQTDLGSRLQEACGFSPLYLRYNTGRHISKNGQELAGVLQNLCDSWPVPVESLTLVGHSMGGLVIRSACWYADSRGDPWAGRLRRILFLGTPHHGAPLEKAGHMFDVAMRSIQYVEPLMFGRKRSAGIKDLRYGNLLDEDWRREDEDSFSTDSRRVVPLLPGVEYYFSAASVGSDEVSLKGQILGDLLVRLGSATGSHTDQLRKMQVKPENCRIFLERNHLDLLDDPRVHDQVISWFTN